MASECSPLNTDEVDRLRLEVAALDKDARALRELRDMQARRIAELEANYQTLLDDSVEMRMRIGKLVEAFRAYLGEG